MWHHIAVEFTQTSGQFQYDAEGRRAQFKGRDGVTLIYTYDALGRLTQTRNNNSGAVSITTYDAAGQVLTSKDPRNNVTTYAYDDTGRRTTVTNALSQMTTFVYDLTTVSPQPLLCSRSQCPANRGQFSITHLTIAKETN